MEKKSFFKRSFGEHSTLVKRIVIGGWIIIGVVFIIIILAVISSDDKKNVAEQKRLMSEVKCNSAVRSKLKAPSSADFADPFDGVASVIKGQDDNSVIYDFISYVDAKNDFGVKLRKKFKCRIQYNIGAENWSIIELNWIE